MSPERLEMLSQQDFNSKVVNINKISLIYGDEVSRVRISRSVLQEENYFIIFIVTTLFIQNYF